MSTPLTKLNVVNQMLGLLGESGLNSLSEPHTKVPDALDKLEQASTYVQADMWWFNVEYPVLHPQAGTGYLLVPNDTGSCDSLTACPRLAVRGNRLYNLDKSTDVFEYSLRVRLHRILPFEDAPILARAHIAARAKLDFQKDYDGDQLKVQILQREVQDTYTRMHAEHIRAEHSNMLYRPSTLNTLMNINGNRRAWQGTTVTRRAFP